MSQKENTDDESRTAILSTLIGSESISTDKKDEEEKEEERIKLRRKMIKLFDEIVRGNGEEAEEAIKKKEIDKPSLY